MKNGLIPFLLQPLYSNDLDSRLSRNDETESRSPQPVIPTGMPPNALVGGGNPHQRRLCHTRRNQIEGNATRIFKIRIMSSRPRIICSAGRIHL